ncbi:MAG: efflux RND transporter permease subunit [Oscillospiraceae bacterium]|nr:efflux RND transporter permease subunit [Oscillospiraceae bacterium]
MWDKIIRKLIEHRVAVILVVAAIVVGGLYCYYVIPKQENPDTSVAAAYITTVYPGASPDDVDQFVTTRLEDKIMQLDHIGSVQSQSINSASIIVIMYDFDVGIDEVFPALKEAISDAQSELPDTCLESEVTSVMISQTQFIISLSGEHYELGDLVDYGSTIRSELLKVDGVTQVDIEGERTRQVSVKLDVGRMQMYGVSIESVLQVLQAQNLSIPSGAIEYETGAITVNTPGIFTSLADIENTVIGGSSSSVAFVKLKDVADVSLTYADSYYYEQDGQPAVMLVGYFEDGINAVNIGKRVRAAIETLRTELPEDLLFHEVMFSPEDVDTSINNFILNLIESVLLIVLVVMLGVQLRNGIIISISIPLSIFLTFIAMKLFDIEFQFISIAALIISLGILVDNAIVISEAIQQHLNAGEERVSAIVAAVRETYRPVLTSTLTTFATFAILFFVPGTVGKVVSTIPIVVISALTASYLVAMIITPVMAYIFFKPESEKAINRKSPVRQFFLRLLEFGLRHKKLTLSLSFGTLLVGLLLMTQLGVKFFPNSTKPVLYINIDTETVSLSQTGRVVDDIGDILEASPLVDHYSSAVGTDMPHFFITVASRADSDNAAQIMIQLNEDELAKLGSTTDAARALQQQINARVSGAAITVRTLEYSMPTDAAVTLLVTGDDIDAITEKADAIGAELTSISGTDNVRVVAPTSEYQYVVNMDSDIVSSFGMLKYDLVKQINTAVMGATASTYYSGGQEMDIVLSADIDSLDTLLNMPISSSAGSSYVRLGQMVDVSLENVRSSVKRYNGELYVSVLSDVSSGYSAIGIETQLNSRMDEMDLSDVEVVSNGEYKNMMDLIGNLYKTVSVAIFVIFLIIYFQFKSLTKPLIIIASIPLSLIGCCFGLWLFNMDLQAMAILGAVSLFGIVVNNGIVLMEVMETERAQGKSIHAACVDAVTSRIRPILLTSITTCIGLVPLILANDPMTAPMASVLLFGMLFATVLTMAVVPVLYASSEERKQRKNGNRLIK